MYFNTIYFQYNVHKKIHLENQPNICQYKAVFLTIQNGTMGQEQMGTRQKQWERTNHKYGIDLAKLYQIRKSNKTGICETNLALI